MTSWVVTWFDLLIGDVFGLGVFTVGAWVVVRLTEPTDDD